MAKNKNKNRGENQQAQAVALVERGRSNAAGVHMTAGMRPRSARNRNAIKDSMRFA